MSLHRMSRRYHKWLMLIVGLQFVIWSLTGSYMVVLNIDYIHGDSLVNQSSSSLNSADVNFELHQLYRGYPNAEMIELTTLLDQAVYQFIEKKQNYLISADTGQLLSPINKEHAVAVAKHLYEKVDSTIIDVRLISDNPPFELSSKHLPVWRIDFDDFANPSFYISSRTGKLVTKRHSFWRLFDWMFSFHVMDYVEEDPSNKLLLSFSVLSLIGSVFGIILIYFRVLSKPNKKGVKNATC